MNNKYIVLDISEIGKELLPFGTLLAADICLDYCRMSRAENKVVILDEVWSLIGAGSNAQAAEFVLELFKTGARLRRVRYCRLAGLGGLLCAGKRQIRQGTGQQQPHKFALMTEPERLCSFSSTTS